MSAAVVVAIVAGTPMALAGNSAAARIGNGKPYVVELAGQGGTGTALLTLNPGHEELCYQIDVMLSTPGDVPHEPGPGVGAAHIHVLPSGGIAVDLEASFASTGDGGFSSSGCVDVSRDLILEIIRNPEKYYVNVHTVSFPGGAVRGDLSA